MRLYIICALLISLVVYSHAQSYSFRHLSTEDGLSHDQITDIYQDSEGFMWVSTAWGLNRYDGYRSKQYLNSTTDSTTVRNNFVHWVRDIADNKLYVHAANGDCIYDKEKDIFSYNVAKYIPEDAHESNVITYVDQHHNIWVASNTDLFVSINSTTDLIMVIPTVTIESPITGIVENNHQLVFATQGGQVGAVDLSNFDETLRGGVIAEVMQGNLAKGRNKPFIDNEGEFWFVNRDALGLWRYTPRGNKWAYYDDSANSLYKIPHYLIRYITQDRKGVLWLATDHAGVFLIDKKNQTTSSLRHIESDERSLRSDAMNCVNTDRNGTVWLGYYQSGLSYYNPSNFKFDIDKLDYLRHLDRKFVANITTIEQGRDDKIWLGTNGSGLACIDTKTETYKLYRHNDKDPNSLPSDVIVTLKVASDGKLWIGTYFGGLSVFDGNKFTNYIDKTNIPESVSSKNIWAIEEMKNGMMWIGSLNKGLCLYDPGTNTYTEYTREKDHILSNYISCLEAASNSNYIYAGTERGLFQISASGNNNDIRQIDSENLFPQLHEHIHDVREDSRGLLWVGTNAGLCAYNPTLNTCITFKIFSDDVNDYISSIEEDDMHNIWITTAGGLTNIRVIPAPTQEPPYKFEQFHYTKDDGLENGTYNIRAMRLLSDNRILVGRSFGVSSFKPNDLHLNQEPPQVHFTALKMFGKEAKPETIQFDASPLKKQLYFATEGIELPSHISMFTIEYSTLNYILPHKTTYTYHLEGMTSSRETTKNAEITYTNLLPGKYTLYVTATNGDGYTNNFEYALPIHVLPAWYASPIAFVVYSLLLFILVWGTIQLIILFMHTKYEKHSKYETELRKGIIQEHKERLIKNITNEFCVPLNEIAAQVGAIKEGIGSEDYAEKINDLDTKVKKLQTSFNTLLNLHMASSDQVTISAERLDIVSHIRNIFKTFESHDSQNIEYAFYASQPNIMMDFDPDKISTAISQIMSNAAKNTPAYGQISVSIEAQPENVSIMITDSGSGISKKHKAHIFDKFYQSSKDDTGYGIELHAAQELIKLHNGTITAQDNPSGQGSQFVIVLPYVQAESITSNSSYGEQTVQNIEESDKDLISNTKKWIEDNMLSDFSVEDLARNLHISRVQLYKKITSYTGKTPVEYIRYIRLQHAANLLRERNTSLFDVAKSSGFSNVDYFEQYFKEEFGVSAEEYRISKRE